MEALLYFSVWAALLFLMMRLGCGSHVMGHGHGSKPERQPSQQGSSGLRWQAPEKDVDPVCGKTVSTVRAKSSVYDGYVYYFCSRECREVFEAMPETYVPAPSNQTTQMLEHVHE